MEPIEVDGTTVCAVVVMYCPGDDALENIVAMTRECGPVLIVDNGSSPSATAAAAALPRVELIALGENRGIAAALNHGIRRARDIGAEWIVTFDQDSRPEPGFLVALLATRDRLLEAAVIGPRIEEIAIGGDYRWLRSHRRWRGFFKRVRCDDRDLSDVTMVVTSGALVSLTAWDQLGGFDESLFIDFVDTDFCLRARAAGYRIAVSAGARLRHQLGRRERREVLGMAFHPTHHSPLRHYYIARNRVHMLRRHARRETHWLCFELAVVILWLFRVVTFEQERWVKLKAMLLGTWDGLLGRSGRCPLRRKAALER